MAWMLNSVSKADGTKLPESKAAERFSMAFGSLITRNVADAAKLTTKRFAPDTEYVFDLRVTNLDKEVTHEHVFAKVSGKQLNARLDALASGDVRKFTDTKVKYPALRRAVTAFDLDD